MPKYKKIWIGKLVDRNGITRQVASDYDKHECFVKLTKQLNRYGASMRNATLEKVNPDMLDKGSDLR